MTYQKINYRVELRRLAGGQKTAIPASEIAGLVEPWVKAGLAQTDIEQLERLYSLPDPRGLLIQGANLSDVKPLGLRDSGGFIHRVGLLGETGMESYTALGKFLQLFRFKRRPFYAREYEFYDVRRFVNLIGVEEMTAIDLAVNKFMGIAPEKTGCVPFVRRIENLTRFSDLHSDSHIFKPFRRCSK